MYHGLLGDDINHTPLSEVFAHPQTPYITSVLLLSLYSNQLLTLNALTLSVWAYSKTISL